MGKKTTGIGAELSLGGDLRFASEDIKFKFDHLNKGITPNCGGIGFLSTIVSPTYARNWVLSASDVSVNSLVESGFLYKTYNDENRNEIIFNSLQDIAKQGHVQRIQAKRSFLEGISSELSKAINYEICFASAGFVTDDWKESLQAKLEDRPPEFTSAKDMAKVIKIIQKTKDDNNSDPTPIN